MMLMLLLSGLHFAGEQAPAQNGVMAYSACVEKSAALFANSPDPAETVADASLQACAQLRQAAVAEVAALSTAVVGKSAPSVAWEQAEEVVSKEARKDAILAVVKARSK